MTLAPPPSKEAVSDLEAAVGNPSRAIIALLFVSSAVLLWFCAAERATVPKPVERRSEIPDARRARDVRGEVPRVPVAGAEASHQPDPPARGVPLWGRTVARGSGEPVPQVDLTITSLDEDVELPDERQ